MMAFKEARTWVRRHPLLILVIIFLFADIAIFSILFTSYPGVLTVAFLDVGQGDAVFIQAPNGNQILYDSGPPSNAALRALGRVLPFYDHAIDVAVISHPDMDHIGGFPEVFRRYAIDAAIEPGATSDNGVYGAIESAIVSEKSAHFLARRGMRIILGDGVYADIVYPDRDASRMDTNDASVVMRIVYGDTSFLVSGDLPKNIEEYLVGREGINIRSTVLKIGHHGSKTSTSPPWLSAVQPDIAIISAGLNNRYGHPHQEVLGLLEEMHIPYIITAKEGTIVFESDGTHVSRR